MRTPPRLSQPLQLEPFHHLCHMALSVPRTKVSIRFGPQETAAGDEAGRRPGSPSRSSSSRSTTCATWHCPFRGRSSPAGWPPRRTRRCPT